jgi:AraC-like DNA-binding protein
MAWPLKIFFALWLFVVFDAISIAQVRNNNIFNENFWQATNLIEQTGDSVRRLITEINESADLTDLQKVKIDQIHSKLNILESMLHVLLPAELIPADTNGFYGALINDAQKLLIQSRPDESIPLLLTFLQGVNNMGDSATYAKIYLAEAYRQKQEHVKGIEIIYDILKNPNISIGNRAFAYNRMAALQNESRNFEGNKSDSVRRYSQLCIDISQKHNLTEYLALAQNELGNNYLGRNMPDSALILFNEAANNFLGIKKFPQAINTYLNLSRLYLSIGQPEESKDILLKALELGNIEENRNLFMYVYYYLANISFRSGDYADAYEYLLVSYQLMSRFYTDRMQLQINEMSAKYALQEKEAKIREEVHKNKVYILRIKYLAVVSLVIISLLIILMIMSRLKSRAYKKLVEQNLKKIRMDKQVELCLRNLTETEIMNRVGTTDRHAELALRLEKFMAEEKPYLWSDVGLEEFCKKLNTNRTYLSNLINEKFSMGFYDFLFEYRVKAALEYLGKDQYRHLSVEAIGEMTGFKSSSTFYKRFKSAVGMTPYQFRERAQKFKNPPLT